MELEWSEKKMLGLIKKAFDGEVMLPDFQRNFIWTRTDIEELIKSLIENMFIGTFLIQRVDPNNLPFKVIAIEGSEILNHKFIKKPEILILDGQQRLTSLFYALYSPDIPLKNTANPYIFFLNLEELSNDNIEDSVFSWSREWRDYKALLNQEENFDINKLKERKLIPLSYLLDESQFWDFWHGGFKENFDEKNGKKIIKYIKNILGYQINMLSIPLTEKPEDIAILFERVNRTGIKLSIFDLLTARLYKFINLREKWEMAFNRNYKIRKLSLDDIKNTKIPYYFIQGLALSRDISIKARDIIKINDSILNSEQWSRAVSIIEDNVLVRLFDVNEYGIANPKKWLSYPSMISILLALFIKAEEKKIAIDITKINKWYWSVIFTERYSGSTETKLMKDYKDLIDWLNNSTNIPEAVQDLRNRLVNMPFTTRYPGSSLYKGVFNLLFKKGAWDFYEKDKIKFSVKDLEDHHIFPRKFIESKNVEVEKDIVLNRTLILSSTNRRISKKAPAAYIEEMMKIHGSEDEVKKIFEKHFIDKEMFEILKKVHENTSPSDIKELFNEFIKKREQFIKNEINNLTK